MSRVDNADVGCGCCLFTAGVLLLIIGGSFAAGSVVLVLHLIKLLL